MGKAGSEEDSFLYRVVERLQEIDFLHQDVRLGLQLCPVYVATVHILQRKTWPTMSAPPRAGPRVSLMPPPSASDTRALPGEL